MMKVKKCWGERKDENRAHQSWATQLIYWKCEGREKDGIESYSTCLLVLASTLNIPF